MVKDTFSYKGWLVSDYFYRRFLALTGYYLIGLGCSLILSMIISFIVNAVW
jgi:hypothetical protein